MRPEEAEKLLGGYATGSLTSEERQALFAAALDDQKLFDTLADEEALRDALSDDTFRRELIATLSQTKPSLVGRFAAWWQRPSALAWAGACAAVVMAAVIVHQLGDPTQPPPQDIAMVSKQKVAPVPAPEIQRGLEAPAPRRFAQEVLVTGQDTKEPAQTAATAVSSSDRRDEPRKEPSMELAERDQAAPPAPQPRVAATPAEEAKSEVASMLDVVEAEMPVTAAEKVGVSRLRQAAPAAVVAGRGGYATRTSSTEERSVLSGLRYRVERADSGGAWSTVAASSSFGLEDALRLRVEADVSGYLTVTDSADPSGAPVFSGSVTADGAYTIPSAGSLPAPTQPGPRTLRLVLQGARTGVEEITLRYEDR